VLEVRDFSRLVYSGVVIGWFW